MGERKVLNKYYDPYFNPQALTKRVFKPNRQCIVTMMMPFSMRCNTCGHYANIGTKFNMRMEQCEGEDYLNIKKYRFYFKCTTCHAELSFKTDPKNSDYVVENGGVRNYDPWRDMQNAKQRLLEDKEADEEGNAMRYLENKTYDSKREMDILDAIDETQHLNKRKTKISPDDLLKIVTKEKQEKQLNEEYEKKFKNIGIFLEDQEEENQVQKEQENLLKTEEKEDLFQFNKKVKLVKKVQNSQNNNEKQENQEQKKVDKQLNVKKAIFDYDSSDND